jgi:hypothetical protein
VPTRRRAARQGEGVPRAAGIGGDRPCVGVAGRGALVDVEARSAVAAKQAEADIVADNRVGADEDAADVAVERGGVSSAGLVSAFSSFSGFIV